MYILAIAGFAFMAIGKVGPNITSKEIDKKIADRYKETLRILQPIFVVVLILLLARIGYQFLHLYKDGNLVQVHNKSLKADAVPARP